MSNCPIWGTAAEVTPLGGSKLVQSKRAGGEYRLSGTAEAILPEMSDEEKARLTSWLVEQRMSGEMQPFVQSDTLTAAKGRRPLRHSEKKRRLLLWLSDHRWSPRHVLHAWGRSSPLMTQTVESISAWTEALSVEETTAFLRLMIEEGVFNQVEMGRLRLTARGFDQLEAVESGGAVTLQGFVAMWFDDRLTHAYENGIAPAIEACGFRAFRVDRKETINKIDDEIIAELRRSRFVVADFTCDIFEVDGLRRADARGGVYFEAGFAQGIGVPVIWTVRHDCINEVHFDTRQFAHIVWTDADDLKAKLVNRIRAVIPGAQG